MNVATSLLGSTQKNESLFPSLSWKTRLYGFVICLIVSFLLNIASFPAITSLILGKPAKFAIIYTLGNLVAILSTTLIVGPKAQFAAMFKDGRRIAASVYVGSMILVLVMCYYRVRAILILTGVIIQVFALFWYCLSYIPFARALAKKILGRYISVSDESS